MYVLHERPDSASLIIRLVLEEMGQPYRTVLVPGEDAAKPDFRALQPMGLVPALETPDGPMFETAAILLWLSEKHAAMAPAPGSAERAAFLKWLFFTSTNIHPVLLQLFYPHRVAGDGCVDAALTHSRARMETALGILEDVVAKDQPDWISGNNPSILCYYIAVLMRWMNGAGDGLAHVASADFPALHAMLTALQSRPAALACANAEGLGQTIFTHPTLV